MRRRRRTDLVSPASTRGTALSGDLRRYPGFHGFRRAAAGGAARSAAGGAQRAAAGGFTLLEVLIALAVLSVCLLAIYQGYSTALSISAATRKLWKAMEYSHNELARWERMNPAPEVSVAQGVFPPGDPMAEYSWKREITDLEPLPSVKVRRVRLDLYWTLGTAAQTYRASLYVLPPDLPAASGSASQTPAAPGGRQPGTKPTGPAGGAQQGGGGQHGGGGPGGGPGVGGPGGGPGGRPGGGPGGRPGGGPPGPRVPHGAGP